MTVRIKICGITSEKDALAAAEFGADALGFIFGPSPRRISAERAQQIIEVLPPLVQTVGVFVNENPHRVMSIAAVCGLDILQFHGDEPAGYCGGFEGRVVKAVRLASREDLPALSAYSDIVDCFLLDTYVENKIGGTGITFDWELAVEAKKHGRIILAGGLNPENIGDAIEKVRPYAVDASSGLERSPGVKDHGKMAQFIERVRQTTNR